MKNAKKPPRGESLLRVDSPRAPGSGQRQGSFYCGVCDRETLHTIELVTAAAPRVEAPYDVRQDLGKAAALAKLKAEAEQEARREQATAARDHGHRICQVCKSVRCSRPQDCPQRAAVAAAISHARNVAELAQVVRMDAPDVAVGHVRLPPGRRSRR